MHLVNLYDTFRLQHIQNSLAHVVVRIPKSSHITPVAYLNPYIGSE